MRTPVAVTERNGAIIVVCDDGTVWNDGGGMDWKLEGKPVPGTSAAG